MRPIWSGYLLAKLLLLRRSGSLSLAPSCAVALIVISIIGPIVSSRRRRRHRRAANSFIRNCGRVLACVCVCDAKEVSATETHTRTHTLVIPYTYAMCCGRDQPRYRTGVPNEASERAIFAQPNPTAIAHTRTHTLNICSYSRRPSRFASPSPLHYIPSGRVWCLCCVGVCVCCFRCAHTRSHTHVVVVVAALRYRSLVRVCSPSVLRVPSSHTHSRARTRSHILTVSSGVVVSVEPSRLKVSQHEFS